MEQDQLGALAEIAQQPRPKTSSSPQLIRWLMDMLAGKRNDPSWDKEGRALPPQAALDRPILSMPPPGLGNGGASGLEDKVGGVLEALQRRKQQQNAIRDAVQ